ncbi:dihydrofolate reductase [Saccharicrinis carchari]|uniref:Dihydrofolate reductase n=1 Tax=Saccharicrinis carchari TaxID=1168039 RepID=A0A521CSP7_SACCC|nr:dihydrofolate reductase [Saccharicrinis carchari]SMO61751.1 dihydrofolate reductase [Saccharicrinis carchari]
MTKISLIAAIAEMNAIGQNNDLLAYIPNDLKRFKALTSNHTIIMGRKTFDTLPNGALPNRRNLVISRNTDLHLPDAEVVHSPEAALDLCDNQSEVFVIGGATIYAAFLPKADKLYLTLIDKFFNDADTFFPEFDKAQWREVYKEKITDDHRSNFNYTYINLERIK